MKIAIMKFSTDVEWVTEPVKIEEYQYWNRLEARWPYLYGGDAFMELSKAFPQHILSSPSLSFCAGYFPVIRWFSNDDWKKGLDTLKQNKWFAMG